MASKSYGIHDKWVDINKINNVDIKSVDGVIESVKINGEEAGGGGDFTTANVTFLSTSIQTEFKAIAIYDDGMACTTIPFGGGLDSTVKLVLYKGRQFVDIPDDKTVTVTGSATIDDVGQGIIITGDCTITIA